MLKGRGVKPKVEIEPAEGLLNFGNIIVGETYEKTFKIMNVSSFEVKFVLESQVFGIENRKKSVPFLMIPQTASIPANETYEVKIVFQPDFASNHFFDVLKIAIPNQQKEHFVYLRGQSHERQLAARIYEPFEKRPIEELRGNYEKPLDLLNQPNLSGSKQRLVLTYLRDEEAIKYVDYKFKSDQNRVRQIAISSCRLTDIKMEKPCSFEINPKVSSTPPFQTVFVGG